MSAAIKSRVPEVLKKHQSDLLKEWVAQQLSSTTLRSDLMKESTLREQSAKFLNLFQEATQSGNLTDLSAGAWTTVKGLLSEISAGRARQGFSAAETATFIFSLKQPLFDRLRQEYAKDADGLVSDLWQATSVLDKLGLMTTELFQASSRRSDCSTAEGIIRAVYARGAFVGRSLGTAPDRNAGQRADAGRHGKFAAENRRDRLSHRHHRYYRRADRRYLGCATSPKDGCSGSTHGSRLYHQRDSPSDRPDHRPLGSRSQGCDYKGDAGRCAGHRIPADRCHRSKSWDQIGLLLIAHRKRQRHSNPIR